MKGFRRGTGRSLVVIAVLGAVLAIPVAAVAQGERIGVVDETLLAQGYTQYINAKQALDTRLRELDEQLPFRQWLEEKDAKRFDDLVKKDNLGALEKTELSKLIQAGKDRNARYLKLVGQTSRTDAEVAEVKGIDELLKKNSSGTRALGDELQEKMRAQDEKMDEDYSNKALGTIKNIAEQKKLLLVVRRAAVVWNGDSIDITKEAIALINK